MEKHNCTIVTYAQDCIASFEIQPFNEVDSVILSQLSYLHFPEEVLAKNETGSCTFSDLLLEEYYPQMFFELWSPEENLRLLRNVALNPRYRDVRLCLRREEKDHKVAKQFSAVTYQIRPDLTYVAYRGTDKTLTGWKEDFKMCLREPVPAQTLAAEYLTHVGNIFRGRLIVGGHSKGGNLAVYAAANCAPDVQDRITEVYSHDGPGFVAEDLAKEGFRRIQSKIRKTAPQFSIFGMLLHQEVEPKIIYSYENGIMQHNPISWKTEGCSLSRYWYSERVSQSIKNKLNNWVENLTDAERALFIDTVFEVLEETGVTSFREIQENLFRYIPIIIGGIARLDSGMQMFLMDLLKQFIYASDESRECCDHGAHDGGQPGQPGGQGDRPHGQTNGYSRPGDSGSIYQDHSNQPQDIQDLMRKYDEMDVPETDESMADTETSDEGDCDDTCDDGDTYEIPPMKDLHDDIHSDYFSDIDQMISSLIDQERIKDAVDEGIASLLYHLRRK